MNSTGYIYGARSDAGNARREARPDFEESGNVAPLQPAKITAAASGVYTVVTLKDDGEDGTEITGIRAFPAADLSVDDLVWLVRWPGNPVPMIMVSGGGGSCYQAAEDWGILF